MPCTKYEDFDKENSNYKFLSEAIENGTIVLSESECVAYINAAPLRIGFGLGMQAYLRAQGYESFIGFDHFPQGE